MPRRLSLAVRHFGPGAFGPAHVLARHPTTRSGSRPGWRLAPGGDGPALWAPPSRALA